MGKKKSKENSDREIVFEVSGKMCEQFRGKQKGRLRSTIKQNKADSTELKDKTA